MANLCLSAYCRKCFPSGRKTGQKGSWLPQIGRRRCGTPRCWRCWQESLFFFQEGSVLSVYFTRKLLILYTRSYNFWLASYPQIARSKRSSGSDFPSYLGILATINKTAVYASYLTRWNKFCVQRQCDPLRLPVDMVLQFLTLYEEGLGYSAINTARTALSAVVIPVSYTHLRAHET